MNYEHLLNGLSPKLKAISKKVARRYSYCDEDDFYQEAALRLWVLFERGELADNTESYILQGCYYFLKNYIRKINKGIDNNSVSLHSVIDEEGHTAEDVVSSGVYTESSDSVEIFLLLDEVEGNFSGREKEVFYSRLEGLTTREIGGRLDISHVMVVKIQKKMREKCEVLRKEFI